MHGALRTTLRAASEVQVVHGHGLYYEPYDLSVLAALTTRRPLVLSPYFYERHRWYWTSYLRVHRLSSSVPATIVAVSNYERKMIQRWGLAGRREIRVIYPRIEVPESEPRTIPVRASDVLRCCFIGRISAAKGVLDVPAIVGRSLERGLQLSLDIAGPDDGDLSALMKMVRRSRLEEHISYLGTVSEEEKVRMLERSDALILPTRYEAFGIVLAEAMAHGCVPVAYDVGAIREVLGDGSCGVVVGERNVESMVDALVRLARSPDEWAEMVSNGFDRSRDEFGGKRWVDAWSALYSELAG